MTNALKLLSALFCALCLLLGSETAEAYSYAAAGKEPLIEGREAILQAIGKNDWASAAKAAAALKEDITYLNDHHDQGLQKAFEDGVNKKDKTATATALRRAFTAELDRRMEGAEKNLNDYQAARVLLMKGKRFLDAMAGDLSGPQRSAAEDGLNRALAAIGNPGLFGAGRRPADPVAFGAARQAVKAALVP